MISSKINNNFKFKNVNIKNDFKEIKNKFFENLGKKISKNFYVWRYSNKNQLLCYIVKKKKTIIGHVGFIKYKTHSGHYFVSRHSSFVDKFYRRKNLYTQLIKDCLIKLKKKNILFVLI